MPKISQREARRLKKRVAELETILNRQRLAFLREWPGGVHIDTITANHTEWHIASTARKLGHAVVIVPGENPKLNVYACPLQK